MSEISGYRDLIVWQKSMELARTVYLITENFPKSELYGLTSQMRRAAVAIPSNIAEGRLRGHSKEFVQFLLIAFSSGAELETQTALAKRLPGMTHIDYTATEKLLDEVMRMLNAMITKLRSKNS